MPIFWNFHHLFSHLYFFDGRRACEEAATASAYLQRICARGESEQGRPKGLVTALDQVFIIIPAN
jgi:hypothetical protein